MKLEKMETKTDIIKTTEYLMENGAKVVEVITNDLEKSYSIVSNNDMSLVPLKNKIDFLKNPNLCFFSVFGKKKKIEKLEDLKNVHMYYFYFMGEIIFDLEMNPISKPYSFSYIGSLSEKIPNDENYKKLISKLKKHPFVLKLEEEEIPYYNSNFNGQKGLKNARILISQEKYQEIYQKSIVLDKKYWSVKMGDAIKMSSLNDFNIFGSEISELLSIHHSQEMFYEN